MGTPDFAQIALKALIDAGYDIACVYSQPPRPKGRGQQVQLSAVHAYADTLGIPVFTPSSLKTAEAQAEFAAHNLDVAVVAAYGLILPEAVLNAPHYGCLNIHASLLPRWRGAAPIQYAIWKGDNQSGVTIMQMEKGLDTGPMILKGATEIASTTTSSALHDELAKIGGDLIVQVLDILAKNGQIESEIQDNAHSNYASMLKKEDGLINWKGNAQDIDRQIRALNPWPGVWTQTNTGKRIKILSATVAIAGADMEDKDIAETPHKANTDAGTPQPGTVLDKKGHVQCANGSVLRLISLQPEGKSAMDFSSAINGSYINPQGIFS